jgi:hypothetical protein
MPKPSIWKKRQLEITRAKDSIRIKREGPEHMYLIKDPLTGQETVVASPRAWDIFDKTPLVLPGFVGVTRITIA